MDTFLPSSCGTVMMPLFQGFFSAPSWQTFPSLACGWSVATDRHTITTSVWLTGATTVTHCSRFSVCLGCPLDTKRWQRWGAVIRLAAQWVPESAVIRVLCDDATKKKAGTPLAGLARYRHGAGSARQAYRTLRGLHFVLGVRRVPLTRWPGHSLSVPVGLALSLKPAQAPTLHGPYRSRRQLARARLDGIAQQLPGRSLRSLADGGYATKDSVRAFPASTPRVGRLPISATRSQVPPKPTTKRRGAPRKTGDLLGSPTTLAQTSTGWAPPPSEEGPAFQAGCGRWHSVWPGRLLRVVVVRREATRCITPTGPRKPLPPVAAFCTTALPLSPQDIVDESRQRWAVEIAMRDTNAFDGLGQEQCRKRQRIMGANTFRLVMAAARTRWFVDHVEHSMTCTLCRYRPWYSQKIAPSQLDVGWACRETLPEGGIFPLPRFTPDLAENHQEPENVLPLAA